MKPWMTMREISLKGLAIGVALANPLAAADTRETLRKRIGEATEPRILFVGNSYSFKIPGVLRNLAQKEKKRIVVEKVTKGGWTLQKHAGSQQTLGRIREAKWDVVVLQEQSQIPSFARAQRRNQMIPPAKILVAEIRKSGAIPVFFQTWGRRDGDRQNSAAFPRDTFEKMQARLSEGYREAAEAAGGVLIVPVGEAWAKEMEAGRGRRLYARDGSHPSADGVLHSARIFYHYLFGGE